jgi:F-type H+-transporting ATPase subunit b
MELIKPDIGTLFWMVLFFGIIFFILGKFAWKPILNTLKNREQDINDALQSADRVKEEMVRLKADNEKILTEARQQRDLMMHEARNIKDKIISDAQEQSQIEAKKIIENARQAIENEKKSAINEIKGQIAIISVTIAEKIIR